MLDDGDPWQKFILASFFFGYAVPQVYAGYLSQKYGGYVVLLCAASIWTLATVLSVPAYVYGGPLCLCLCRVLVGIAEGCNYPCQMSLALKWFPAHERTTLWTLLGAGEAAGTILAMSTSAQIATSIGWSYIFFLSGALGLCFVLIFYIFASKDPESHTLIRSRERDMIVEKRLKKLSPFTNKKIPWYNIITYRPFLATVSTHFAYNYQAYLALSLGPYFFKARYNVDISDPSSTLGVFACLPYVVSLFTGPLAGVIADELVKREIVTSWTGSRKIMNSAGMLSCAIFYGCLALPLIQNSGLALGVTMLTCGISLGILAPAGYWANYQDLSSTYGSVLCGLGNTIATIPGVLGNLVSGYIVGHCTKNDKDNTYDCDGTSSQWSAVFGISSAISLIGALIFISFASAEQVDFDNIGKTDGVVVKTGSQQEEDDDDDENSSSEHVLLGHYVSI